MENSNKIVFNQDELREIRAALVEKANGFYSSYKRALPGSAAQNWLLERCEELDAIIERIPEDD
nr:MAG TPA: hypothetical protein [Caudoviricetes sp.]